MRPWQWRDGKVRVFQGTRNLYSRRPSALSTGILCAFRETDVTRQLILKIPIIRPPPSRFVARSVIYLANLPHLSGAPLELFSRPRHGRLEFRDFCLLATISFSLFLCLSVSSSILGDKLYGAQNWFSVNCIYPSRVLIRDTPYCRACSSAIQRTELLREVLHWL